MVDEVAVFPSPASDRWTWGLSINDKVRTGMSFRARDLSDVIASETSLADLVAVTGFKGETTAKLSLRRCFPRLFTILTIRESSADSSISQSTLWLLSRVYTSQVRT
jgi:hypothetical protein